MIRKFTLRHAFITLPLISSLFFLPGCGGGNQQQAASGSQFPQGYGYNYSPYSSGSIPGVIGSSSGSAGASISPAQLQALDSSLGAGASQAMTNAMNGLGNPNTLNNSVGAIMAMLQQLAQKDPTGQAMQALVPVLNQMTADIQQANQQAQQATSQAAKNSIWLKLGQMLLALLAQILPQLLSLI